ncbi:MAG: class I SAM-dependent methyltransferase [Pseudomonadales bacterium]|nr:class I SAM-dependent methyltransferase [Pseudomonadales bacterium]
MFAIILLIISGVILAAVVLYFGMQVLYASTMLHGPVFVPSKPKDVAQMIKLAQLKKSDKILDLGSGDGTVVLALAKLAYQAHGVDINPLLVRKARKKAVALELSERVTFERANFWSLDLSEYDVIFFYGTTYVMKKLEKKLFAELKPGSRVVSNYFEFPTWKPAREQGKIRVYEK